MMNKKTGLDFKNQAETNSITNWPIHNCTFCRYECGYVFKDGKAFYDSGCDCGCGYNVTLLTWDDVAEQYNMQSHPDVISKMNKFWGFKS